MTGGTDAPCTASTRSRCRAMETLSPVARALLDELVPTIERIVDERVQARGESAPGPGPRPVLLTAQAVAEALGCKAERVHALWRSGALPYVDLALLVSSTRMRRLPRGWLHVASQVLGGKPIDRLPTAVGIEGPEFAYLSVGRVAELLSCSEGHVRAMRIPSASWPSPAGRWRIHRKSFLAWLATEIDGAIALWELRRGDREAAA